MTAVTTNRVAAHSVRAPSLLTPALIFRRRIGRLLTACGRGLVDASRAYALAQELAYVRPGRVSVEMQRLVLDTDGDGRDPSW
jgi:hypothetical protein